MNKKLNNRELIEEKLKSYDCVIGCYHSEIDELPKKILDKVIEEMNQEHTDVFLNIDGKLFIVEISTVDEEKDFRVFNGVEYFSLYGNLEDALENETITKKQYEYIYNKING